MAHIIVMGADSGRHACRLRNARNAPRRALHQVVSAVDYFQFTPSNPWVAVGWRVREAVTLPIAPLLEKKGIGFVAKAVTAIDAPANRLTLGGATTCSTTTTWSSPPARSCPSTKCRDQGRTGGHTHFI